MALVPNFNRIINLHFLSASDSPTIINDIVCPLSGRKPNIEINGQLSTNNNLHALNIKVKNLYLENLSQQYGSIRVVAGYKNQPKIAMTGSIMSIFPETPGPEGTTVIQCVSGKFENWLDKYINLNLDAGFTLQQAILLITKSLGLDTPDIDLNIGVKTSPVSLQIQDKAAFVIPELKKLFPNVEIVTQSNKISAWANNSPSSKLAQELKFLSAPPQLVAGNGNNCMAWITAPWDPSLKPGDKIKIDQRTFSLKNALAVPKDSGTYVINTIDFHFSTVGKINQMTILAGAL